MKAARKAASRVMQAILNTRDRLNGTHRRRNQILAHGWNGRTPRVPSVIVPDLPATSRDEEIATRLLAAYEHASNLADKNAVERTWVLGQPPKFMRVLARGDAAELATVLCNMSRHDVTTGTVQGDGELWRIGTNPSYRRFLTLMAKDKLVSLAEATGAIAIENPEQGEWGHGLRMSCDELLARVNSKLPVEFVPPAIDGGLLKIPAGEALLGERDLNAVYTALLLSRITPPTSGSAVCEIGAGSGRVAYWAHRLGYRDYTLLDLPHQNVVHGFYLMKTLPDATFVLSGEQAQDEAFTILPYFVKEDLQQDSFDLVFNQDSLPEIDEETVIDYLRWIGSVSRRHFLSINHESRPPHPAGGAAQQSVPEMAAAVGGLRLASREQYWLRKGYAAELYEVG